MSTCIETRQKIAQIKEYDGVKLTDAKTLTNGDIGVLCGLTQCGVGTIYGSEKPVPKGYVMTRPLISTRLLVNETDYPRLLSATRELNAEDPLLNMFWEREHRELILSITGLMQIEILQQIYKSRFGLDVTFENPTVIYKETPLTVAEGYEAYTWPKPCWAIIRFRIEPLPAGSGVIYESVIGPDQLLLRYQAQIAQALPDALKQGPKGWEVTDLRITLIGGNCHVYHTHPLDFIVATPMALMDGLVNAGTGLLEPYLTFTLTAPESLAAKLLGEITSMRGYYDETSIINEKITVRGAYPLAAGMDFPQKLAMLTGSRALLAAQFDKYTACMPGFVKTQPYRGISPLDRAKYILHIRHAL